MKSLIAQLPRHYQTSPQDTELQRALTTLLAQVQTDLDFTLKQLIPSTASGWGLALWETAYGIRPQAGADEDQRRSRVLAKLQGTGMTTVHKLKSIAQSFWPGSVEVVEHYASYAFEVWLVGTAGPIDDEAGLIDAINELKPAHLDWVVKYLLAQKSPIYMGALPRQGDKIIWKVDCTHDT